MTTPPNKPAGRGRYSIRTRLILTFNALVLSVGLVAGWAGIQRTSALVEARLVDESVRKAATILAEMHLPLSDGLLRRFGQVLGGLMAAGPADQAVISHAGLTPEQRRELETQWGKSAALPRIVVVEGRRYCVASAGFAGAGPVAATPLRLFLLVPETDLRAAKYAASRRILELTALAVGIATLAGWWLSLALTRPVRGMAAELDRLAHGVETGGEVLPAAGSLAAAGGPVELRQFAAAFDRLLDQLARSRRQLAQSAQLAALGRLSASVVHELRNPLSGIKMNATVLAGRLAREGRSEKSLELIGREVDRMNLYLEELLALAGNAAAVRETQALDRARCPEVRLDELADSVLVLLGGRMKHAGVAVETALDPDALTVRGDAGRLRQVLLNLFLNALEAMPGGGTVRLASLRTPQGAVRVTVEDTGGGVKLPAGAEGSLFEPFVSTKPKGGGLGLYICRQIIAAHGGRIGYENTAAGARFWVELPP